MFVIVINFLINFRLSTVRKRTLELLNNKLQHNPEFFVNCDRKILHDKLLTSIMTTIKNCQQSNLHAEQELIIQKACFSLKLLTKMLTSENPQSFVQILEDLSDLTKKYGGNLHENILASMMLCIAELCNTLKVYAIPCLNRFMPFLLKTLRAPPALDYPTLLITSNVAAVNKILDSLLLFLSPYIEKLTYEISVLSSKWHQIEDQKLATFVKKLKSVQDKLSSAPISVLLIAITNSYEKLISKGQYSAVGPLMSILSDSIANLNEEDIQINLSDLTSFFLEALKFRSKNSATVTESDEVEAHVIRAFVTLAFKLSESSFRPLYSEFFIWAVEAENEKSERVITFYNLSYVFAKSLKGLFVLFAGQFINNTSILLDACNLTAKESNDLYFEEEEKNIALLENILRTLEVVFTYASESIASKQRFMNKTRFEMLKMPLVNQLDNLLGGAEKLRERANNILTPCIVQFAFATNDDSLWKLMNYEILLKLRHKLPAIRLIALNCLGQTALKLGEDFMPMLPETVPFLAELLEDSEEDVEKACRKMIQDLEKVLGTSLQEYF